VSVLLCFNFKFIEFKTNGESFSTHHQNYVYQHIMHYAIGGLATRPAGPEEGAPIKETGSD
jgi:hypothetical protein